MMDGRRPPGGCFTHIYVGTYVKYSQLTLLSEAFVQSASPWRRIPLKEVIHLSGAASLAENNNRFHTILSEVIIRKLSQKLSHSPCSVLP